MQSYEACHFVSDEKNESVCFVAEKEKHYDCQQEEKEIRE
jgi:hypothetical protein